MPQHSYIPTWSFFDLPLEVRALIYKEYYASFTPEWCVQDGFLPSSQKGVHLTGVPSCDLELVCRAIRDEVSAYKFGWRKLTISKQGTIMHISPPATFFEPIPFAAVAPSLETLTLKAEQYYAMGCYTHWQTPDWNCTMQACPKLKHLRVVMQHPYLSSQSPWNPRFGSDRLHLKVCKNDVDSVVKHFHRGVHIGLRDAAQQFERRFGTDWSVTASVSWRWCAPEHSPKPPTLTMSSPLQLPDPASLFWDTYGVVSYRPERVELILWECYDNLGDFRIFRHGVENIPQLTHLRIGWTRQFTKLRSNGPLPAKGQGTYVSEQTVSQPGVMAMMPVSIRVAGSRPTVIQPEELWQVSVAGRGSMWQDLKQLFVPQ